MFWEGKFFVLSFEDNTVRAAHTEYFLLKVEIKDYNVMINGKNFFDQPVKNDLRTYNIRKIATGQEDDYTTGCLIDYPYFKKHNMITIDLSKQQTLDADPKAIQQINVTGYQDRAATMFFITEEAK